jgi:hypothetical protein
MLVDESGKENKHFLVETADADIFLWADKQ